MALAEIFTSAFRSEGQRSTLNSTLLQVTGGRSLDSRDMLELEAAKNHRVFHVFIFTWTFLPRASERAASKLDSRVVEVRKAFENDHCIPKSPLRAQTAERSRARVSISFSLGWAGGMGTQERSPPGGESSL
jgi:hypothetical protein